MIESAATVKEAQALARHATPQLTMNVYGRAREQGLSDTVVRVAGALELDEKCATRLQQPEIGLKEENATAFENKALRLEDHGGAEGNRTPDLLNAIQALSQLSYSPTGRRKIRNLLRASRMPAQSPLITRPMLRSVAP